MPKAVVIRLSSLGDVVLASAAVRALADAGWRIGFITKPEYAPMYSGDPRIEQLIEFTSLGETRRQIKKFRPDAVVDLHNNQRSWLMTLGLGVRTVRVRKRTLARRLCVWFGIGDKSPRSVVDDHLAALKKIGVDAPNTLPQIFPTETGLCEAEKFLERLRPPIAVIHPGARYPLKQWGDQRFARLGHILKERGFEVLFIGESAGNDDFVHTGRISLEALVGIISQAALFFGNDSGPAHIAAALGVPTITIFGPTHPCLGFVPRGKFAAHLHSGIECSPCTLHGEGRCKYSSPRCFEQITPELVAERGLELYRKFASSSQK